MGTVRLRMSQKEINEAHRSGIPESIIGRMAIGMDLSEQEKKIVNIRGKVYVQAHTKEKGRTLVKPQLRNLPGGNNRKFPRSMLGGKEHNMAIWFLEDLNFRITFGEPIGETKRKLKEMGVPDYLVKMVTQHTRPKKDDALRRYGKWSDIAPEIRREIERIETGE